MRTFHYAGVATVNVTQGLPRIIEIVDARKTPDTPTMNIYVEELDSRANLWLTMKLLQASQPLLRRLQLKILQILMLRSHSDTSCSN